MHFNRQKLKPRSKLTICPNKKRTKIKNISPPPLNKNKKTKRRINTKNKYVRNIKDVKVNRSIKSKNFLYDHKKYKALNEWKNILKGEPAFLLGNGLSISKQNLSLLNSYFTLGMNRIFYLYEPTVLIWQDIELWKTNKNDILGLKSIRVCRDVSDPRKYFLNFKLAQDPYLFKKRPEYLHGRGNTGGITTQFAVALGCSCVVFLGMDCKYGLKGQTDFYGINKDHKEYTLSMCRKTMKWLNKHCPIPIYNCSNIDIWPKRKLEDVIKELKPNKYSRRYFQRLFSK